MPVKRNSYISLILLLCCFSAQGQFVYFDKTVDFSGTSQTLNNTVYSDEGDFLFASRCNSISEFSGFIALGTIDNLGNVIDTVKYSKQNAAYTFGSLINIEGANGYVFIGTERLYHDSVNYTNADALVIRYNQDKSIRWAKRAGDFNKYDFCLGGFLSSDGGFLAVAQSGDSLQTTADIVLMKLDSNGNTLWKQYYGGSEYESANSGVETPDGGFMILGWTRSFGAGSRDFYLVKTDTAGNQQWQETYGTSGLESGSVIIGVEDGNYILGGGAGTGFATLIKVNPMGGVIWQKEYSYPQSGEGGNYIFGGKELPNGDLVLSGVTDKTDEGNAGWLLKTDSEGNMLWQRKYNHNEYTDLFYDVLPTDDGGFLLSGHCYNEEINSQDAWLVKVDSVGCPYENCLVGIDEVEKKVIVDIWPNPASEVLNLEFQEQCAEVAIELIDISGKVVYSAIERNPNKTQIDVSGLVPGVYVLRVTGSEMLVAEKIVIH